MVYIIGQDEHSRCDGASAPDLTETRTRHALFIDTS